MKALALVFAIATVAACSDRQPVADAPAGNAAAGVDASAEAPPVEEVGVNPEPLPPPVAPDGTKLEADDLGRWTGVEGMSLMVAAKPGSGVTLDMQWDLDNKGVFDESVTAEGLRFMRNGVAESAVHTGGDATGLKYLAGKQDCRTVKAGEGYCRD